MSKVAFLVSGITDNGVTKVLSILLDNINYDEHDVSVVVTRYSKKKRSLNPKAYIIEAQRNQVSRFRGKIKEILSIREVIKKEHFDYVIALGNYTAMYTLLATFNMNVKKIVSERNDPNSEPSKKIYRAFRNFLYRSVDAIVCQTSDAGDYYKNIVPKRVIIPNPVNSNLPVFQDKRDHRVVNFCRIDEQKNLKLLIDAFSEFSDRFPNYRLEIYGDGPLKGEIKEYIAFKEMSFKIKMFEFCLDIHEKIKSAGMFVSSSNFEGMSNSMLEAMAMGIPTICTDCPIGGAREVIITGKNGILVPIKNKKALVDAMIKIATDDNFADMLSLESVKIKERLSVDKICEQWWKLIEQT